MIASLPRGIFWVIGYLVLFGGGAILLAYLGRKSP